MSLLTEKSKTKENKGSALVIGDKARIAKQNDPKIINATIGMLFDDNNEFYSFNIVKKAMEELNNLEKFAYPTTAGDENLHSAIRKWVFRGYEQEILKTMSCSVIATPGGSGAIYSTFKNYVAPGESIILPTPNWSNYIQIANEVGTSIKYYDMFDCNGNFNLEDLKQRCIESKEEQNRIMLVINDPCHNPTGYCMKDNEWKELITILNELSSDNTPIILLYDMAYIDYQYVNLDHSRKNLLLLKNLNESVLPILAFSGSKTLGLYGLRVGAQIALSRSKKAVEEFFNANEFTARGTWSASSMLGMNIIKKVFLEHMDEFEAELRIASELIVNRANVFIEECQKNDIKTLPYDCGFFATINVKNPKLIYEKLIEEKLHVLPLEDSIRIALSSANEDEIRRSVVIIKKVLSKYN